MNLSVYAHVAGKSASRGAVWFRLLVAGAFAFLTIPRLAQSGMFLDGTIYAAISRNLAEGVGTFWFPSFTAIDTNFHEHPPLGFALQAAAFALFGDHLAVERAYAVTLAGLTGFLTMLIWRRTLGAPEYDWLPIVFWLLPSTVTWSIINNLLETTQTLFTTAAVLTFLVSLQSGRGRYAWSSLAGACVVGAVLTKGPNGFFPLAAPLVAAVLCSRKRTSALRSGLAMLATVGGAAGLILSSSDARVALRAYWEVQVAASITGARGSGRWVSLIRHLAGGIVARMGGVLLLAWLCGGFHRGIPPNGETRGGVWPSFFLLLALAGSLPVAFSARVSGHYLVPALPMWALAFAAFALPLMKRRFDVWQGNKIVSRAVGSLAAMVLLASVVLPLTGRTFEPRDAEWIAEYRTLSPVLPRRTTMGTCEAASSEWGIQAYMQRFFRITLDPTPDRQHRYYLRVTGRQCDSPHHCLQVRATSRLELLDCSGGPSIGEIYTSHDQAAQ